jgi:hypothetical protein
MSLLSPSPVLYLMAVLALLLKLSYLNLSYPRRLAISSTFLMWVVMLLLKPFGGLLDLCRGKFSSTLILGVAPLPMRAFPLVI